MLIDLLGSKVPSRDLVCSFNGEPMRPVDGPYVNLYVRMTDSCQASCGFCNLHDESKTRPFDELKLMYLMEEIAKVAKIKKVAFTGGEPTLNFEEFTRTLNLVHSFDPTIPLTLNTNGLNFRKLVDKDIHSKIECLSLSRHHYDDIKNAELLGVKHNPYTLVDLRDFPNKDNLHLRCNLIKGGIDSLDEANKYISSMSELGIRDFGFVSLMQFNDFCRENFISFQDVDLDRVKNARVIRTWSKESCICKNYLMYTDNGKIIKYYARVNGDVSDCSSTLVYDQDTLRIGFTGATII
jgi:pyruvate-formate lyase-activating enzyme